VLGYLIDHAGRVVTTEKLLTVFWAGKTTEQSTIHRRINMIRTALGDSSKSAEYIATPPKRGYRLIAPVTTSATTAASIGNADAIVLAVAALFSTGKYRSPRYHLK